MGVFEDYMSGLVYGIKRYYLHVFFSFVAVYHVIKLSIPFWSGNWGL